MQGDLMKKLAMLTTSITIIFVSVLVLGAAAGQTYTPGVVAGNVFKYQFNFDATVNGDNQFELPSLFDSLVEQAKSIDWVEVTITDVSGSTVNAQMVTQFKNGTQETTEGSVDVATGEGDLGMFLIASNLGPNSPLHMNSNEIINGTTTRTYSSESRNVNYEKITMEYDVSQEELSDFNISVPLNQVNTQESYWDKQTGALVEMSYHMSTTSSLVNADITLNVNLLESNVYTIPEFPALILILVLLFVPTFAVLRFRKQKFN